MSECLTSTIECAAEVCYLVREATDGICTRPVFFNPASNTRRVHHHQNETTPALSEA